MTEREKFIMRAALLYAQSNLYDLNEAFSNENTDLDTISVNGDESDKIQETEVAELLFTLQ
jgi:hypothetical protein